VDAQQARRVLDRIVGYKVSRSLGQGAPAAFAGRVRRALRLIVEREMLIRAFVPQEYWTNFVNPQCGRAPGAPAARPPDCIYLPGLSKAARMALGVISLKVTRKIFFGSIATTSFLASVSSSFLTALPVLRPSS